MPKEGQNWIKRHPYLTTLIVLFGVGILVNSSFEASTQSSQRQQSNISESLHNLIGSEIPIPTVEYFKTSTPTSTPYLYQSSGLSNDNYYINVDRNTVHAPAYSDTTPAGASARCRDGTYSFSQNRRGTCSRHGGVASWL